MFISRSLKIKHWFTHLFFCYLLTGAHVAAQEKGNVTTQEEALIEAQAAGTDDDFDDDSYLVTSDDFRKHRLAVNSADENAFRELRILTDLQIHQFIAYRSLLGKLISLYELQAVPGWDLETIQKVLPFITLNENEPFLKNLLPRTRGGSNDILVRTSFVPQKSEGYLRADTGKAGYAGSGMRLFARYNYNYKNLLQFGILGDKDAGEEFFRGARQTGFDFYSWHFFVRKIGFMEAMAIGDYSVSMGQGLIHWQGGGLRKNADAMMVKRQGPVLKPYRSAGEYNFQRGIGITLRLKRFYLTIFGSYRRLSSSLDTDENGIFVSSIVTSGYHRTALESAKRKNLEAISGGIVLKYVFSGGHFAFNTVGYKFGLPLKPQPKPYDLYGINGAHWFNSGIDYSYTFRNLHSYGELAVDRNGKPAFLQGFLLALDRRFDLSLVYRALHPAYQTITGNSFTENTSPSNETGLYTGFSLRPAIGWLINVYGDVFRSPWLRFNTDAPASGRGYLFQVVHKPNKQVEIFGRFSNELKHLNVAGSAMITPEIENISKKELRIQFSNQLNKSVLFRSRIAMSWYGQVEGPEPTKGFLGFTDFVWKPATGIVSGSFRLQYFDMDNYNTRIYAYENGPLYDMSIPAVYGTGWKFYANVHLKPVIRRGKNDGLQVWLKYGQAINKSDGYFGSGLDKINRPSKSDIRFQINYCW